MAKVPVKIYIREYDVEKLMDLPGEGQ